MVTRSAAFLCSATRVGTLCFAALLVLGCATTEVQIHELPRPSADERYCAWYGEARDDVLYFGQAPFWWAMRTSGGSPRADLATAGPQLIGRFDLAARELLASLDVSEYGERGEPGQPSEPSSRSGVWDVLPHPNGRIYFTTFFESAGAIDPRSGEVVRFDGLGTGLNELALGPEGAIVATRYGGYGGDPEASGSVVLFSPDGLLLAEYPLRAPKGFVLAPKTVAWDEKGGRYWLTTDLVQRDPKVAPPPSEHPTIVLDAAGAEIARVAGRELQFVRFGRDGQGVGAFASKGALRLMELGPGAPRWQLEVIPGKVLDPEFSARFDFVQDIAFGPEREVIVTRWSGRIHVVSADGSQRDVQLPRDDPTGLYYSSALAGDTVCSTWCSDVAVVCAQLP